MLRSVLGAFIGIIGLIGLIVGVNIARTSFAYISVSACGY